MKIVSTFVFMTTKEEFQWKHLQAIAKLQKTAEKKVFLHGLVFCAQKIAPNLGVSSQTIINYLSGRTTDGYLTEAITKEFRILKFD